MGTRWLVASVTAGHRHLVTLRPKGQRTRSQGYRVQTVCIVHDRLGVGLHDATTRLLRFSIVCNRPRSKSRRPLWYKGLDKQQQLTVTLQRATSTFFDTRSSIMFFRTGSGTYDTVRPDPAWKSFYSSAESWLFDRNALQWGAVCIQTITMHAIFDERYFMTVKSQIKPVPSCRGVDPYGTGGHVPSIF